MDALELIRGQLTTDIPTAARLLGIGRNSAYAAAARGDIPVQRIGSRIVVLVEPLLKQLGADPHR